MLQQPLLTHGGCCCRAKAAVPLASQQRSASQVAELQGLQADPGLSPSQRIGSATSPYINPRWGALRGECIYSSADLLSLVHTLLTSSWVTIAAAQAAAVERAQQKAAAQDAAELAALASGGTVSKGMLGAADGNAAIRQQPAAPDAGTRDEDWLSWGWLQRFFGPLRASSRQVGLLTQSLVSEQRGLAAWQKALGTHLCFAWKLPSVWLQKQSAGCCRLAWMTSYIPGSSETGWRQDRKCSRIAAYQPAGGVQHSPLSWSTICALQCGRRRAVTAAQGCAVHGVPALPAPRNVARRTGPAAPHQPPQAGI